MAPRKLSDSDKSDIIELYRQPDQTTSTLASQYGVSNSTISRILKLSLPPEEYSQLISQKRMAGGVDKTDAAAKAKPAKNKTEKQPGRKRRSRKSAAAEPTAENDTATSEEASSTNTPKLKKASQAADSEAETASEPRRRRRRRRKATEDDEQLPLLSEDETTAETADDEESKDENKQRSSTAPAPILAKDSASEDEEEDDDDDDPLAGLDETLGDDFGDDDLDEEEEEDDDDDTVEVPKPKLQTKSAMSIMPLDEAIMPKPCYLVVDMRAELITRPLSEFADLGQVPSSEEKSKTLPVFDNHRVARRFSRNKQRVIKVPDGDLITRTSPYLTAKGITRLLVDGQVFDLVGMK